MNRSYGLPRLCSAPNIRRWFGEGAPNFGPPQDLRAAVGMAGELCGSQPLGPFWDSVAPEAISG